MTQQYDHFSFCRDVARKLIVPGYEDHEVTFLSATGGETYTSLDERLSTLTGPVLIAVDENMMESQWTGADGLSDSSRLLILLILPVQGSDVSTTDVAVQTAARSLRQIRNLLLLSFGTRVHDMAIYPTGLVSDSYMGECLEFLMDSMEPFTVDASFFKTDDEP